MKLDFLLQTRELTKYAHAPGIPQENTLYSDGVPGVTMRQIDPGRTFVYRWKATTSGSYWWHSHQKAQIEDGLYGPITIYPKPGTPKPWSLISSDPLTIAALEAADENVQPILVGDMEHRESTEIYELTKKSGIEVECYDSIIINGQGRVHCLPEEQINNLTNPSVMSVLQSFNTSLTSKA